MYHRHQVRLALLLTLAACLVAPASAGAAFPGNPIAGADWFVDPGSAAARAARHSAQLKTIAETPQATWFVASDDPIHYSYVRDWFTRWRRSGRGAAAVTLHGLPHYDCSGDNAPGHRTAKAYKHWIDQWARAIGGRRVVVFLEPDALASSNCLTSGLRVERFGLMSYAASRLSQLPQTAVYEDAGAGDWRSVKDAVSMLKRAGVRYARGFSLNVTHFDWTAAEIGYGKQVSRQLGGKPFVVNTSANGRGPEVGPRNYHYWCNPRGRALGPLPTSQTPDPLVDGFFWVNNPGLSDGSCNGGPRVGTFWAQWALELTRNASSARDYPTLHAKR
jgi:endoglucanase